MYKRNLLPTIIIASVVLSILAIGVPKGPAVFSAIPSVPRYQCRSIGGYGELVLSANPRKAQDIAVIITRYRNRISDLLTIINKIHKPSQQARKTRLEAEQASVRAQLKALLDCRNGKLVVPIPTPVGKSLCGNRILEAGEECDSGSTCCDEACHNKPAATSCSLTLVSALGDCESTGCDGAGNCSILAKAGACNDGKPCTVNDRCVGRSCLGEAVSPMQAPIIECGVGECKRSVNTCTNGESCVPGQPTVEVCNGLDDDCNGVADDSLGTLSCGQGACSTIINACEDGMPQICVPTARQSEICNGSDDDCNGLIDDNIAAQSCGRGACARSVDACVNGQAQACSPGVPQTETCNGIDDDCNGSVDDGLGTQTCGQGTCNRTVLNCKNGQSSRCMPGTPSPTEICNGLDDDCNGFIDDGFASKSCGRGACARSVVTCLNGVIQDCIPGEPSAEACNGIDDDCNDRVDDGIAPLSCGQGACERHVAACVNGISQVCVPGSPSTEICNGHDDDCNGLVDEGGAALCGSYPNMNTACAVGACWYTCQAGYANPDNSLSNGCEINLTNDVNNCGSLGNVCADAEGLCQVARCQNSTCTVANKPEGEECLSVTSGHGYCADGYLYGRGTFTCDAYGVCRGAAMISCSQLQCYSYYGCITGCSLYNSSSCGDPKYFICQPGPYPGVSNYCAPT